MSGDTIASMTSGRLASAEGSYPLLMNLHKRGPTSERDIALATPAGRSGSTPPIQDDLGTTDTYSRVVRGGSKTLQRRGLSCVNAQCPAFTLCKHFGVG